MDEELTTEMHAEYDENIDRVPTDDLGNAANTATKKETIFDHNVTDEEIKELCGFLVDKDEFIAEYSQNVHYATIYRLLMMRGEKDKKVYFDRLQNTLGKWFSLGNRCCI